MKLMILQACTAESYDFVSRDIAENDFRIGKMMTIQ